MNKIEQLKKEYKELAEWSDRMTVAANMMLNRGQGEEIIGLRKLIEEWTERFEDKFYQINII